MRVGVLRSSNQIKTINPTLRAFMIHGDVDVMSRKLRAKRDGGRVVTRIRAEVSSGRRYMESLSVFALHLVMLEPRAIFQHNLNHRIRKIRGLVCAQVALNQRR